MRALTTVAILLLAGTALTRPAVAETIDDAMAATYASNPTLQAQRSALRSTDESASQAGAGWRPTVQIIGNVGKGTENKNAVPGLSAGGTQSLLPNTQELQVLQQIGRAHV